MVDGHVAQDEWLGAQHVVDFRKVQLFNGDPHRLPVEAWVLGTPDGFASAFRTTEPRAMRAHPRT